MIHEDRQTQELVHMKQAQSKQDMIQSYREKKATHERNRQIDDHENELVQRYAQEQSLRSQKIQDQKAEVEAEREKIFEELKIKEERRRAEDDYNEQLRT